MTQHIIEFEDWFVEAENEDDAVKKAEARMEEGDIPKICFVEEDD